MNQNFEGWYALAIHQAFPSMKAAADMSDAHECYSDEVKRGLLAMLASLDKRAYGAGIFTVDGVFLVVEKLRTGSVVGMVTYPAVRAQSPSEAVSLAREHGLNQCGPLAVKYLRMERDTPTSLFLN